MGKEGRPLPKTSRQMIIPVSELRPDDGFQKMLEEIGTQGARLENARDGIHTNLDIIDKNWEDLIKLNGDYECLYLGDIQRLGVVLVSMKYTYTEDSGDSETSEENTEGVAWVACHLYSGKNKEGLKKYFAVRFDGEERDGKDVTLHKLPLNRARSSQGVNYFVIRRESTFLGLPLKDSIEITPDNGLNFDELAKQKGTLLQAGKASLELNFVSIDMGCLLKLREEVSSIGEVDRLKELEELTEILATSLEKGDVVIVQGEEDNPNSDEK